MIDQQQQPQDQQINCHSNHSLKSPCIAASPQEQIINQKNPIPIIQLCQSSQKLTIQNVVLVMKNIKKVKMLNAKVHSKDQSKDSALKLINQWSSNIDRSNNIYSIQDHLNDLQKNVKDITIENSRVNMYALKKLVALSSKHLVKLKIANCTFFESDLYAVEERNISNNNKMLRELIFAFQIKALKLPEIEDIQIYLKKSSRKDQTLQDQEQIDKTNDEPENLKMRENIAKQYGCNKNSYFVEYELNLKDTLEKKYKANSDQNEIMEYILNGHTQDKDDIEEVINENIIKDIQEHAHTFTKYIKGSLIMEIPTIMIVKGYSLEDPIASNMVYHMINKNRKDIKTVIFKQTGIISLENFRKVIDSLLLVKNLESIAFFDSVPSSDCYALLKELYGMKHFKYIVLNRSFFNIYQFREQVFGQEIIHENNNKDLMFETPPKHNAFYILYQTILYEFTPYKKDMIKQLFFITKSEENSQKLEEFGKEEELDNEEELYEFEVLIKRQNEYEEAVKKEIQKYQNSKVFSYQESISEQIMTKYHNKMGKDENLNQVELEKDLLLLQKHPSFQNINLTIQMLQKLQDTTVRDLISKFQGNQFRKYRYNKGNEVLSIKYLLNTFLLEQGLFPCKLKSHLSDNWLESVNFPKKEKIKVIDINKNSKVDNNQYLLNSNYVKELLNNKNIKGFNCQLLQDGFSIYYLFLDDKILLKKRIYYKNFYSGFEQPFLTVCIPFLQNQQLLRILLVLKEIQMKRNDVDISTEIDLVGDDIKIDDILYTQNMYWSKLQEAGILELDSLKINFDSSYFSIPTGLKIKKVKIKKMPEIKELEGDFFFEEIIFYDCIISKNFKINNFKELKHLTFIHCQLSLDLLILNNINYFEEQNKKRQEEVSSKKNHTNLILSIHRSSDNKLSISLSDKLIDELLNNRFGLNFKITDIETESISLISEKQQKLCTVPEYNLPFLNQIFGMNISEYSIPFNMQVIKNDAPKHNQQLDIQIQSNINNYNQEVSLKRPKFSFKQICNTPPKIYLQNGLINNIPEFETDIVDAKQHKIPQCCLQSFKNNSLNEGRNIEYENFQNFLEAHLNTSDCFCLFKRSLFQNMLFPRKFKVCLSGNLLVNDIIIYDYNELNNIEELTFANSEFNNILFLKFIDFIIQSSPKLKKLKFKNVTMLQDEKQTEHMPPYTISLINHFQLKILVLETCFKQTSRFIMSGVLQFSPNQLEKINFRQKKEKENENENEDSNPDQNDIENQQKFIESMLKQQKNSILCIKLILFTTQIREVLLKCVKLQKLHLLNISQKLEELNDLLKIQALEEIQIEKKDPDIDELKNFLETCFKERNHLMRVCFSNKKYDSFKTYLIKQKHQNQHSSKEEPLQIIQFEIEFLNKISIDLLSELASLEEYDLIEQQLIIEKLSLAPPIYLILDQNFDLHYLNEIFVVSQSSLRFLSFKECNLTQNSFKKVDFNKLPKTVTRIDFSYNNISSLMFMQPFCSKERGVHYKKITINITQTDISNSEIVEYQNYFKKIIFKGSYSLINRFSFLLQYVYKDNSKQYKYNMFEFIIDARIAKLSEDDMKIFYKFIFDQNKIHQITPIFKVSPLQLISSDIENNEALLDICNQQKRYLFSPQNNLFLFYCEWLLRSNQKYIFGYSKNHHQPNFSIYKLSNIIMDKYFEKQKLTLDEYSFSDYLQTQSMQEKFDIKHIHLPLRLQVSFNMMHNQKLGTSISEEDMIQYLSRFPPSEITLEGISMQFIKIWYVINSISPLTFKTTLQNIDSNVIYNTSIGNYLTQKLHRNNFFRKLLSGTTNKYRFDQTVQLLAEDFNSEIENKRHSFLLSFFPLYLFICIFGVIYFSLHFDVICGEGISWYSYCTYLIYGLLTLWIELLLFKRCLNFISHLIPSLEIDLNPNFITSFVNFIKQSIIDTPWINQWYMGYSYSFIQSQIARFDNFTNVGFLYSTYQCGNYVIFYIALSFMAIPFLYSIYQFNKLIWKPNKKHQLPTTSLDIYYRICSLIEFRAVSDILDLVSPSNVISLRGRMFNARIISYFLRIICESMPLVIIQIYNLTQKKITSSLVLSLILSIITFLSLVVSVITITPSTLNQEDFNQLNENKIKNNKIQQYEERLQTVEDETFSMSFYEHLKNLRLEYLGQKKQQKMNNQVMIKHNINKRNYEILFDTTMQQESEEIDYKEKKNQ